MDRISWNNYADLFKRGAFKKEDFALAVQYVHDKANTYYDGAKKVYKDKYDIDLHDHVLEHNIQSLKEAMLDAFSDLKRVRAFHDVGKFNVTKRAAYIAYWWNVRKPFPVVSRQAVDLGRSDIAKMDAKRLLFFNESFLTNFVKSCLFDKNKLICDGDSETLREEAKSINEFIFYQFCYRVQSPQYIESFLASYLCHPRWQTNNRMII